MQRWRLFNPMRIARLTPTQLPGAGGGRLPTFNQKVLTLFFCFFNYKLMPQIRPKLGQLWLCQKCKCMFLCKIMTCFSQNGTHYFIGFSIRLQLCDILTFLKAVSYLKHIHIFFKSSNIILEILQVFINMQLNGLLQYAT